MKYKDGSGPYGVEMHKGSISTQGNLDSPAPNLNVPGYLQEDQH